MKVLMTADTVGGVWSYACELIRALDEHNVQVILATMGAPLSPSQRTEIETLSNATLEESAFKLEWMREPWDDVRAAGDWLLSLEHRYLPDLMHLNGYAHAALPWHAPVLVVAHSDVASWWTAVKREELPAEWSAYKNEVTRGLQGAAMVVAPSGAMMEALEEHYYFGAPARVIYNARNPRDYTVATKEPMVLAAGRLWDEAKNIATLREAAASISWPVYVAGDDAEREEQQNVYPFGKLSPEKLREWMSRASIFVSPALYEPFGLTILEAALSGCALVLSDIASLRELWSGAAVFVDPREPAALARAVESLIESPQRRKQLAAVAAERARKFDPQLMAREYVRVYRKLASPTRDIGDDRREQTAAVR